MQVPHRHLQEDHSIQISYSDIRGATQLSEARERVKNCACGLMTFFIIMLVLTVLVLFSKIAELPQTFQRNLDYENYCIDNSEDNNTTKCEISGILDFVTIIVFILDLICRGVAIFFYAWGIRAASVKRAVHAASLYRVFWFQLCILGVLTLVQLILAFYAYQLVWDGMEEFSQDNEQAQNDHIPELAIYIKLGFVIGVALAIILFASVCACLGCCVYSFKRRTATYESMLQSNPQSVQAQGAHVMQGQVIGAVPVSYVYQPHN